MLRSLYSGVSGMKANQTKMDVIGNNIANASTTAFKAGRTRFQDMLSQTKINAMAPLSSTGGVNPSQVGLGVQIAGIDTIVTQGTMQSTGSNLDVGIDGDGYFMVGKGPEIYSTASAQIPVDSSGTGATHQIQKTGGMDISFTRDGAFTLDNEGNLVTSNGYRVLGYSLSGMPKQTAASSVATGGLTFSFGTGNVLNGYRIDTDNTGTSTPPTLALDTVNKIIKITGMPGETAANVQAAFNLAETGTNALAAAGITTPVTVTGALTTTATGGSKISGGTGAAKQANPVIDASGVAFTIGAGAALNGYSIISSSQTGAVNATVNATTKQIIINGDLSTSSISAIQTALNSALTTAGITTPITVGGTIPATSAGLATTGNTIANGVDDTIVHSIDGTASAPVISFVDGSLSYKADDAMLKTLKIPDSVTDSAGTVLKVTNYSISKDGVISVVLSDGSIAALGQIAMANFKNPAGLEKQGSNLYNQSSNSGIPVIRSGVGAATTDDNSSTFGDMNEGMLEMSNVDLAEQFTDMIVTSRAFQAAGKMISTGDEMLQDIINLKR